MLLDITNFTVINTLVCSTNSFSALLSGYWIWCLTQSKKTVDVFFLQCSHSLFLSTNTDKSNYSLTLCTQWAHEINPSEAVVSGIFWPQHDRARLFFLSVMRGGWRSSGEEQRLGPHACPSSRGPPGAQILFYWQVIHLISFSLSHSPSLSRGSSLSCDMRWLFVARCAGL